MRLSVSDDSMQTWLNVVPAWMVPLKLSGEFI